MADILIRGMDKPTSCDDCPMYTCMHNFDDCHLVELPEHGDLISRERAFQMMLDRGYQKEAAGVILEVPTVIPSNKEDTE